MTISCQFRKPALNITSNTPIAMRDKKRTANRNHAEISREFHRNFDIYNNDTRISSSNQDKNSKKIEWKFWENSLVACIVLRLFIALGIQSPTTKRRNACNTSMLARLPHCLSVWPLLFWNSNRKNGGKKTHGERQSKSGRGFLRKIREFSWKFHENSPWKK